MNLSLYKYNICSSLCLVIPVFTNYYRNCLLWKIQIYLFIYLSNTWVLRVNHILHTWKGGLYIQRFLGKSICTVIPMFTYFFVIKCFFYNLYRHLLISINYNIFCSWKLYFHKKIFFKCSVFFKYFLCSVSPKLFKYFGR